MNKILENKACDDEESDCDDSDDEENFDGRSVAAMPIRV